MSIPLQLILNQKVMALEQKHLTPNRLLIRYNKLVKELIDNSTDHEWEMYQVVEYHDSWLKLASDIDDYIIEQNKDPEDSQIWQNANAFCQYFEKTIDKAAECVGIRVRFGDTTLDNLEATRLNAFDTEYDETPDFFDTDNDDDYEYEDED
jgi:hypothetical protein